MARLSKPIEKRSDPQRIQPEKLRGRLDEALIKRLRQHEQDFATAAFDSGEEAVRDFAWIEPGQFVDEWARDFVTRLFANGGDSRTAAYEANCYLQLMQGITDRFITGDRLDVIAEKVIQTRRALRISQGIQKVAQHLGAEELESAELVLSDTLEGIPTQQAKALDAGDLHLRMTAALGDGFDGFRTGIPQLDRYLRKLVIGDATIIASRTSLGKTTLALQIARNVAYSGERVLIISTEMQAHLLWLKMAAGIALVDSGSAIEGKLSEADQAALATASEDLASKTQGYLYIDDQARTVPEIMRLVSQIKPRLVVVDLLDDLCTGGDAKNQSLELGRTFVALREMGKKYGHHTMIVHQIRREAEDGDNNPPGLRDLRWSGDLEQKTDNAVFIHRLTIKDAAPSLTMFPSELWVRKCRFGPKDVKTGVLFSALAQWFFDDPQDPILLNVYAKEQYSSRASAPAQRLK